jgi:hypothetical protein
MRSLFILLLVINICYFVWGVAFSEKKQTSATIVQPTGVQTLTLLNEQQKEISTTKNTNDLKNSSVTIKETSKPPALSRSCFSLGPILDDKVLRKLEQELEQGGYEIKHKAITDREPKSYWVYFPPEKSLDDAKAVVNQLKIAGVKDYFIVRKGEFIHAISLGLYNGYPRAKLRVSKLKKLGFSPMIETRYHQVTRYWVDYQETSDKPLKDIVWNTLDADNPLQKIVRPCIDPLPYDG